MGLGTMSGGQYYPVPSGSGVVSAELLARISDLENEVSTLKAQKATADAFGLVKLTDASDVTESTGLALPASEKNASIDGTIGNFISKLSNRIGNIKYLPSISEEFGSIKALCDELVQKIRSESTGNIYLFDGLWKRYSNFFCISHYLGVSIAGIVILYGAIYFFSSANSSSGVKVYLLNTTDVE